MRRGGGDGDKSSVTNDLACWGGKWFFFSPITNYFTIRVTVSFLYKFTEVTRSFVGVAGRAGSSGTNNSFRRGGT